MRWVAFSQLQRSCFDLGIWLLSVWSYSPFVHKGFHLIVLHKYVAYLCLIAYSYKCVCAWLALSPVWYWLEIVATEDE